MSRFHKETNHPIFDETIELCREELEKQWQLLVEAFKNDKRVSDKAYASFVEFSTIYFSGHISTFDSPNRADALTIEEEIVSAPLASFY